VCHCDARRATAVLPEPTSPLRGRSSARPSAMSWKASQAERRCALVPLEAQPDLKVSITLLAVRDRARRARLRCLRASAPNAACSSKSSPNAIRARAARQSPSALGLVSQAHRICDGSRCCRSRTSAAAQATGRWAHAPKRDSSGFTKISLGMVAKAGQRFRDLQECASLRLRMCAQTPFATDGYLA